MLVSHRVLLVLFGPHRNLFPEASLRVPILHPGLLRNSSKYPRVLTGFPTLGTQLIDTKERCIFVSILQMTWHAQLTGAEPERGLKPLSVRYQSPHTKPMCSTAWHQTASVPSGPAPFSHAEYHPGHCPSTHPVNAQFPLLQPLHSLFPIISSFHPPRHHINLRLILPHLLASQNLLMCSNVHPTLFSLNLSSKKPSQQSSCNLLITHLKQ